MSAHTKRRADSRWDVYDARGGTTPKQGWYFTLTAISSNTSDEAGAQPVTVKASGKHEGVLSCMTCKLPDCEHIAFVRGYIARNGRNAADAVHQFKQRASWLSEEAAHARNNGTPF